MVEDATAMGARSSVVRTSRPRSSGFVTVITAMAATVLLRPMGLNTRASAQNEGIGSGNVVGC